MGKDKKRATDRLGYTPRDLMAIAVCADVDVKTVRRWLDGEKNMRQANDKAISRALAADKAGWTNWDASPAKKLLDCAVELMEPQQRAAKARASAKGVA